MQKIKFNNARVWGVCLLLVMLTGCQSIQSLRGGSLYREGIPGTASWAVLPFVDHTDAQGGVSTQLERMMMVLLPSAGILYPRLYPESQVTTASQSLAEAHRLQNGKQWAGQNDVSFAITGKVLEWRYDEENRGHVSVDLEVFDVRTDQTLWTTSGSGEGLPGEDLYDVSRKLFSDLLNSLPVNKQK